MYVYGLAVMFVILMIIGILGIPAQSAGISWAIGALIIFMLFCFQLSLGPACYTLVSEMPSTRLRVKTVALSRASYNAAGFITNAVSCLILNSASLLKFLLTNTFVAHAQHGRT